MKINYTTESTQKECRLVYEDGRIVKTEFYGGYNDSWYLTSFWNYFYEGNRIVSEQLIYVIGGDGNGVMIYDTITYELTWSNGRPVKVTNIGTGEVWVASWNGNNLSSFPSGPDTPVFQYDNHKNPLRFPVGFEFLRIGWFDLIDYGCPWSENNYTSNIFFPYQYSYSNDGYPLELSVNGSSITFTYYN